MTTPADKEGLEAAAERIYVGRSVLEAARPRPGLGAADIYRFLTEPGFSLKAEQQRALFSSPDLLAAYREVKAGLSRVELPKLAAASDGALDTRTFDGGLVRVAPSRVEGQVYVIIRCTWPSGPPRALLLEGSNGEFVKRMLPRPDSTGELLMVLRRTDDDDFLFLRLLRDPLSAGLFVV